MPNAPVPAAGEAVPAYSLDDIICDTSLLRHLLDVTTDILCGMSFVSADGTRNRSLDQVNALVFIAASDISRIVANIEANYAALIEGRSA